jgi:hypothetical protein
MCSRPSGLGVGAAQHGNGRGGTDVHGPETP